MFISLECNILQRHEVSSPDKPTTLSLAHGVPGKKSIVGTAPTRRSLYRPGQAGWSGSQLAQRWTSESGPEATLYFIPQG